MSENDDTKKIAIPALNPKEITFDKHGAYELEEIIDPSFLDEVGGGKVEGDVNIICFGNGGCVPALNSCDDDEIENDEW